MITPEDLPDPQLPRFTNNQSNAGRAIDNFFNNGGTLRCRSVAGAALVFGALGHILYPCALLSAKHIINRGQKRGVRYADRFSTPGSSLRP